MCCVGLEVATQSTSPVTMRQPGHRCLLENLMASFLLGLLVSTTFHSPILTIDVVSALQCAALRTHHRLIKVPPQCHLICLPRRLFFPSKTAQGNSPIFVTSPPTIKAASPPPPHLPEFPVGSHCGSESPSTVETAVVVVVVGGGSNEGQQTFLSFLLQIFFLIEETRAFRSSDPRGASFRLAFICLNQSHSAGIRHGKPSFSPEQGRSWPATISPRKETSARITGSLPIPTRCDGV